MLAIVEMAARCGHDRDDEGESQRQGTAKDCEQSQVGGRHGQPRGLGNQEQEYAGQEQSSR